MIVYDAVQLELMEEMCINVSVDDEIIGPVSKKNCIHLQGQEISQFEDLCVYLGHLMVNIVAGKALHRAFSVFLFHKNKLLIQQRSIYKITFPGRWTNTCCSHPLWTETEKAGVEGVKLAAIRKLNQELGLTGLSCEDMHFISRIMYQAPCDDTTWGEHEIDYLLIINCRNLPSLNPNPNEVMNIAYVNEKDLEDICDNSNKITPWFRLIRDHGLLAKLWSHLDDLEKIIDIESITSLQ